MAGRTIRVTDYQRFLFDWGEEDLEVEGLDNGRFRLFHSSLGEMLRWGDVIEAEFVSDGIYRFVRVVEKSRYESQELIVGPLSREKKAQLADFAAANGVILEPTILEGYIFLHLPPGTRKDFSERFSRLYCARSQGFARWKRLLWSMLKI